MSTSSCFKNQCVQIVSVLLRKTSVLSSPHQTRRTVHIYTRPETVFEKQPPSSPDFNLFFCHLWCHIRTSVCSAQLTVKWHVTNAVFMLVKPSASAPEPLKWWESPWSDVSKRALISVEEVQCICCELCLDKQ